MSSTVIKIVAVAAGTLFLAGCADGSPETQDIQGKVLTQSFLIVGNEGDPCIPGNFDAFKSLPGSQITLKDSEGKILGVTNIDIVADAANPEVSGTNEGSDCAYSFTFPQVAVDDQFYSIEFGLKNFSPATLTLEELTSGAVLNY